MDYKKLLLNPARLRILQHAKLRGHVTAAELVAALKDIPRATVYHHVKLLEENGLLVPVAENKVRGVVEKVLAPADTLSAPKSGDRAPLAAALSAELLGELTAYFSRPDADMERDRVFFQKGVFAVTDAEYDDLLGEIKASITKYIGLPKTPARRFRTLALISTPPTEEGGEQP